MELSQKQLRFLKKFIGFRSISANSDALGALKETAEFLWQELQDQGFDAILDDNHSDHPIVFATRGQADAEVSLIIYAHYDVQPPEPLHLWHSEPFTLTERDGRLFARGIGDDKGSIAAILFALRNLGNLPNVRLTIIFEGEEEIGSPNFEKFLRAYGDKIYGDAVLIADVCSATDDIPAICTGLRGLVSWEVTARTGERDIHSGSGGAVPNAIQELVRLCSHLHRDNGEVAIPGFYDDALPPTESEIFAKDELEKWDGGTINCLGVKTLRDFSKNIKPHAIHAFLPSLEFNGIFGGHTESGEKTIIPAEATIKLTARLVPQQNPKRVQELIKRFLFDHAPDFVEITVDMKSHGPAYAIDFSRVTKRFHEQLKTAEQALSEAFGHSPLHLREGGSIGVVNSFKEICGIDSILLGAVSPSAQFHAPNENLSLKNLFRIIKTFELILTSVSGGVALRQALMS